MGGLFGGILWLWNGLGAWLLEIFKKITQGLLYIFIGKKSNNFMKDIDIWIYSNWGWRHFASTLFSSVVAMIISIYYTNEDGWFGAIGFFAFVFGILFWLLYKLDESLT